MRTATCEIIGISPYSQSRPVRAEHLENELPQKYEERTWKERLNCDPEGNVFIPGMAFKNALTSAAQYRSDKVPGKRNATYTKHFTSGVVVTTNASLGIRREDVAGEWLFVPSDGKRGGGSRVWKQFPIIPDPWKTSIEFHILDDAISDEVFKAHLKHAGTLIGLGRFRPQNNGFYGRFKLGAIKWTTLD